ncbi:MAG: exodeoxyribonuclease VII small subunit [Bacillota bacterium]|nr:exodeoxyribonuclease VII small subunit [Bacillota bacterium]
MNKNISYEEAANRLEEIVDELEKGELPLNKSIELYEEGVKLSAYCYDALTKAEQKVIELDKLVSNLEAQSGERESDD